MAKRKSKARAKHSDMMCCAPSQAEMDKYAVDDACRSLKRAKEIEADTMLMGKCKKKLRQEQMDIKELLRTRR